MGMSEDANIEHLLHIFTSIDTDSESTWDACAGFIARLRRHKPRLVTLGSNIEDLPDSHPSKPRCLSRLSELFSEVGNYVESSRLLTHVLKLWRDRGDLRQVAVTLEWLASTKSLTGFPAEEMQLATEALKISEQLGDVLQQARCLSLVAMSLLEDNQVDTAEETASRAIALLPENSKAVTVCRCHHVLGVIYCQKGDREKAIKHFEVSLGTATSHNLHNEAFLAHYSLADLFVRERNFEAINAHLEGAKLHAVNNAGNVAHTVALQGIIFFLQGRYEEAKPEVLRAVEAFEKIGATLDAGTYRRLYDTMEMYEPAASDEPNLNGEC